MTLQEAISILTIHQQWRKGANIVMIEPKELSQAIDIVLDNHLHNQLAEASKMVSDEEIEKVADEFSQNYSIYDSAQDDVQFGFIEGAKWQQERMYSEEDMLEFGKFCHNDAHSVNRVKTFKELFEQFKKK